MKEVSPAELRALLQSAEEMMLPEKLRVTLPSGRICDDWNVFVRGSVVLLRWARDSGRPDIVEREKADMSYLALVGAEAMNARLRQFERNGRN